MEPEISANKYYHSTGGNTIKVEGEVGLLEKLDHALVSGYLERNKEKIPIALYVHITREEDEINFWTLFYSLTRKD